MDTERRCYNVEFRADEDGNILEGYAAVFNSLSQDLGGFREYITPGAFSDAVREDDVRALFNHDPSQVLGRTKSGTLELAEDDNGLQTRINLPDTSYARDLRESVRRGDVDQMSFAFQTVEDDWRKENGANIRELIKVRLLDVSPVTYPAYEATSVSARALETANEMANVDAGEAGAGKPATENGEGAGPQARLENLRLLADVAAKDL